MNGLRPPVVSTQAANGMRSKEPERLEIESRRPFSAGLKPKAFTNGANNTTAAKPMKNPQVVLNRAELELPFKE